MTKTPQDVEQIAKRIKKMQKTSGQSTDDEDKSGFVRAYQIGTRVGAELVSGVLVGAGLGYVLAKFFNTQPTLLAVFLILGGAAGFLNVYRFVKREDARKG